MYSLMSKNIKQYGSVLSCNFCKEDTLALNWDIWSLKYIISALDFTVSKQNGFILPTSHL